VSASTPLLPFMIGTRSSVSGCPIIGPPLMSLAGASVKPPQWSTSACTRVPMGTRRFFGSGDRLPR
jgi:hypothetical protein